MNEAYNSIFYYTQKEFFILGCNVITKMSTFKSPKDYVYQTFISFMEWRFSFGSPGPVNIKFSFVHNSKEIYRIR